MRAHIRPKFRVGPDRQVGAESEHHGSVTQPLNRVHLAVLCVPLIDEYGDNGSTVEDSTISGNSATIAGDGGRIYLELPGLPSPGFQLALAAHIVTEQSGGDCAIVGFEARISDAGYNVDDDGTCGLHSANHSVSSSTVIDNYLGTLGSTAGPRKPCRSSPRHRHSLAHPTPRTG